MSDFTTWRSLVDGEEIGVIPDSEGTHQYNIDQEDEADGSFVFDFIGGLDASIEGSPMFVSGSGVDNRVINLDGTNDYLDLGSDSRAVLSHFTNDGVGTVALWINPSNINDNQFIFGNADSDSEIGVELSPSEDNLNFRGWDGSGSPMWVADGSVVIPDDDWSFVAVVVDGSTAKSFVAKSDDYELSEIASGSISGGTSSDWTFNANIGRNSRSDDRYFDGSVDLSFIDNTARDESNLQNWVDETKQFYD